MITCNRWDFNALHRKANAVHRGIITVSKSQEFELIAARIDAEIRAVIETVGTLDGQLVSVLRPSE